MQMAFLLVTSCVLTQTAPEVTASADTYNPYGVNLQGLDGTSAPLRHAAPEQTASADPNRSPSQAWRGRLGLRFCIVTRDDMEFFADPASDTPLAIPSDERPKLGDRFLVMRETATPWKRYLLARFTVDEERGQRQLERYVGWADPLWLFEDGRILFVDEAILTLSRTFSKDDPRQQRLKKLFPFEYGASTDSRYRNSETPLKVITPPDRNSIASCRPVPPEDLESTDARKRPLDTFGFYHVAAMVPVGEDQVYLLLTRQSDLRISDTALGTNFQLAFSGWVEISQVRLWTTRIAFEPDLRPEAINGRAANPLAVFSRLGHLQDWADRRLDPDSGPVDPSLAPVWIETFSDPLARNYPWDPSWMRWPVMERHDLTGGLMGYRLCVPAGHDATNAILLHSEPDFERHCDFVRQVLNKALIQEVVLCIDATRSMEPVIEATKQAVLGLIDELIEEEQERSNYNRLDLRVAVVVYRDYHSDPPAPLTEDSGKYFHVLAPDQKAEFANYLEGIQCVASIDHREEPLEGLAACEKYTTGPLHASGASTLVLLIGNAGNHLRGEIPQTRYDAQMIAPQFRPVGTDTGEKSARVSVFPVFAVPEPGFDCEAWDEQMSFLAAETGGAVARVPFYLPNMAEQGPGLLRRHIDTAIQKTRDKVDRECEALYGTRFPTPGDTESKPLTLAQLLLLERVKEVCSPEDFNRCQEGLAQRVFADVYVTDRIPEDAEPRFKLAIILTYAEAMSVERACRNLAMSLDDALQAEEEQGVPLTAEDYKRLLIEMMLAVMGRKPTDELVGELMQLPLQEIVDRIIVLPVPIGVLRRPNPPQTAKEMREVIVALMKAAGRIDDICHKQQHRWTCYQLGTRSELHCWFYEEELP